MVMHKSYDAKGKAIEYFVHDSIKEKILDRAMDNVMTKNNSFVGVVDGRSGVGKSTFCIQLCRFLDKDFGLHKMAWTPDKFLDLIQNAKKGDAIMFDEGMIVSSRAATSAVNRAIVIALSQIRSRNIYIFVNINSIFDLDRNIALHRADVLFHMYTVHDKVDSEKRCKVYGRSKLKYLYLMGKKYYSYKTNPNFFARPPRKYVFLLNEKKYEEIKREETMKNAALQDKNTANVKSKRHQSYLGKFAAYIKKHFDMQQKDIAKILNVAPNTISKWISVAKAYKEPKDLF